MFNNLYSHSFRPAGVSGQSESRISSNRELRVMAGCDRKRTLSGGGVTSWCDRKNGG